MPAKMPDLVGNLRGRRIAILLAAVGIILVIVLGGHQKITGFAVNRVAEFLLGAGDVIDREPTEDRNLADSRPIGGEPFSRASIIDEIAPAEAAAEDVAVQPGEEPAAASEAQPDTVTLEPEAQEAADFGRKVVKVYTAAFLRDPFYSLIASGKEKPAKLLEVSGAKMVGSVWGESGIIALIEDSGGRSYALKVGDPVLNGRVSSVTPASITFSITMFGLTKSVTLELAEEGEW